MMKATTRMLIRNCSSDTSSNYSIFKMDNLNSNNNLNIKYNLIPMNDLNEIEEESKSNLINFFIC